MEIDASREAVARQVLGVPDDPQLIIRVGWPVSGAEALPATPRRPLRAVLLPRNPPLPVRPTRGVPGRNFEHEPVLAVLSPYLAGPAADIRTGQALRRVLLTATVLGLSVSFLSQLVEVPTTREELRRLITSTRPPLAVLRIGRGHPVPATPRRDVADLVIPEPADIRG